MKITIYGTGYVGLVTGACLAELGHEVLCLDIDEAKIATLNAGNIHLYEPGLAELVAHGRANGRLQFSTDSQLGLQHGFVQMVAVNTPQAADGSADLSAVMSVIDSIAQGMTEPKLIVMKSTVPVGTHREIIKRLSATLQARDSRLAWHLAANPEFLQEGSAVKNFLEPDRIILGVQDDATKQWLTELYQQYADKCVFMDLASAELAKYAANAMLATRISFMNEIANIAEQFGANVDAVRTSMAQDPRIGSLFLRAGCGYGGACFPKDVTALAHTAQQAGLTPHILLATEAVNRAQRQRLFAKYQAHFAGDFTNRTVAVWGLAFKPNTDDLREAPSGVLLSALWEAGVTVQAYDAIAGDNAKRLYGDRADFHLASDQWQCLEGADCLFILTEDQAFVQADLKRIAQQLAQAVIFDGRNIISRAQAEAAGICYYGIGT